MQQATFRLSTLGMIVILFPMRHPFSIHFVAGDFSGPIEHLLGLVQAKELPIESIHLHALISQYHKYTREENFPLLSIGTEFIYVLACLIWIKSNALLPKHEVQPVTPEEGLLLQESGDNETNGPYPSIKKAAQSLLELERKQNLYFPRPYSPIESPMSLGIDHISLQDLVLLFQNVLSKTANNTKLIQDEEWQGGGFL